MPCVGACRSLRIGLGGSYMRLHHGHAVVHARAARPYCRMFVDGQGTIWDRVRYLRTRYSLDYFPPN
jgi:hypothetical protein